MGNPMLGGNPSMMGGNPGMVSMGNPSMGNNLLY